MLWLALTVGAVGALLGFWMFRVHLVIAGSILLALLCVAVAASAEWTPLVSAGYILVLVGALQAGYLAGVVLLCAWSRAKRATADPAETTRPMIPG